MFLSLYRMEDKIKTLKVTVLNGSIGEFQAEWMTPQDWENHEKAVKRMKAEGTYLKPIEYNVSFIPFEKFDDNTTPNKESYRFIMLDTDGKGIDKVSRE